MTEIKKYEAIIIGSGQAGNPLMTDLSGRGQTVAMIEMNELGGSCINFGCTPTKTLIASSNLHHRVQNSEKLGVFAKNVELDFKKVMQRKNDIVKAFRSSIEKSIERNENIDLYKGKASFLDNHTILIELNDGREQRIKAEKIFINSGSKPNILPLKGLETVPYYDSTSIMELDELPEHLIILGTGYIALEFGQMFRRFGSKVTLIGSGDKIIKHEDQDISNRVQKILEEDGIEFLLNTETTEVKSSDRKVVLHYEKDNMKSKIDCTHFMLATGRVPVTKELNLENTDVKIDDHGDIQVDEKLKTNVNHIYALGDVKGGPQFTHIAYDDYRIVIDDLFGKGERNINDRMIPYTLFIEPQLGRVGLTEAQAKENGFDIEIGKLEMKHLGRAIEEGVTKGFMKAVINKENHEILGVAILGYQGGEILAMVQIAMMAGMKYEQLRDGIFTHPSLSEALNNLFDI
ncbi:MAG: mercuric reductase [Clostridiales bacterium]|nr:mercuric reductase [Clostridiales bacterium]